MSYHVAVRLPDGREALADYRQPIVEVMRRVHKRIMDDPLNKTGKGKGSLADGEDMMLIGEWLDLCPELACPPGMAVRDETCGGKHPPATREPFTPAKYVRPVRHAS